uniref:RNase_Zc3h12a domain-containing protein n=1 Tax=Wuchereria bancrofti TaxID=6293 RepID=A0A1I8EZV0_WUCBA
MRSTKPDRVPKIERVPLSVIFTNGSDNITERSQNRLLRPIFINGVEVGFAYSKGANAVKKLSARGITITLWYFISRGHQAQALLPFCFKSYPDKSNYWDELMALYRMNLVEFTPGFGSDKYVEVNRIMATRAREYGGCMVARSQMHAIVEQNPMLDRTVEEKLLMPSFNGNDIIFPIDGPLGRNGCTLADTLTCTIDDPEWSRCVLQQMSLRDQRIWMTNLANWITTAGQACRHQSLHFISIPSEHLSLEEPQFELHPPETNPPENHGFSKLRHRTRRSRFFDDSANYRRSDYNNSYMDHFSNRRMNWTSNRGFFDTNHYFVPSYRRNPRSYDEKKVSYIGRPNSIYRLNVRSRTSANSDFKNGELTNTDRAGATNSRSRLVKPICDRNPNLFGAKDNFNKLVQTMEVIEHEERDKHGSKKNVDKKQEQVQKKEQQREEKDTRKEKEELLEGNASPKKTKKHPVEDREGSSSGHHNTERDHQLVSPRDDTTVSSVVGAQLQLEIAFKNEIVICSSSNDVESIAVGMASHDKQNDLIHFSDSELENDLLSEAEILM